MAVKGCDVEACILTGEILPFRVTELGGDSGNSCEVGRVINDLRGANNGVGAGFVGEGGGFIDVLAE